MDSLIVSDGNVVTKPVSFHSANTANLYVSSFGQSITSYTPATYAEVPDFTNEPTAILTVGDSAEVTLTATGKPIPTITLEAP